ncbi:23S rRNA (cytosine1962-C5)-methyltransferase [Balneicella halophila]|uniref:23S rRNA (Cytosine1962-C5)-methyltransferase n=1 Tax=Balneicella halophila TaxID=1537566 RepID=A0A7L4UR91_BALHA|nr:class I SAM-dependent rRNA methyltransferase [Balneicella halophila]PVX51961.1 23S rRNA (cytosine1962-C5)-methyltransferase [Balneicella halophila]
MTNNYPIIKLKKGKGRSVTLRHPWIFSGAINGASEPTQEGDIVRVENSNGIFLALGYTQIGSISVRLLAFEDVVIDFEFWKQRIADAYERRSLANLEKESQIFRLVFGESDNIPGLILDYYNGYVVYQAHTVFAYLIQDEIVRALKSVLGEKLKGIYDKSAETLPKNADLETENQWLLGNAEQITASENDLKFYIDFQKGQKTGFFVDQRKNRALLEEYSKDKRVLNICCYSGGFSVYALRGGAKKVVSVDASERAIKLTEKNVALNFNNESRHQSEVADAFDYVEDKAQDFDVIILDPPAFAKHKKVLDNALKGYRRLNRLAMERIPKDGIIFTFSCSQVVSREDFRRVIFQAATEAGREVTILEQLSQPQDHPVSVYHPESEYLKGLVLQVR